MLAIVIPYYKLTFFEETLRSLANQTDKRFKVYVGDDASPENPEALLQKYKGKFDFVYHQFENNLGGITLTKQWERCIALSGDEEWIMVLGDDDYLEESIVASWYKNYPVFKDKVKTIRFSSKIINEKLGTISEPYLHPKYETAGDSWFRKFKGQTRSSLSEYVFSRASYIKYGFQEYPLAWHSDDKAWLDFSENKPIYCINESIVFIRISESSITGKTNNEEGKISGSIQFLEDCVTLKPVLFDKNQFLVLIYAYEVALKKSKKLDLSKSFFLMSLYLKHFKWIPFLKYNRRLLIRFFNL